MKATWRRSLACCLVMFMGLVFAATPTVLGTAGLLRGSNNNNKWRGVAVLPRLLQASGVSEGAVACERYVIITKGSNLTSIAATFSTTVSGLRELNPAWFSEAEVDEPGAGVPLCVVGSVLAARTRKTTTTAARASDDGVAEPKRLGKRPQSTINFTTTPGTHTCYGVVMNAHPPIDLRTFVEMNPTLDCAKMLDTPSTVYLPKGTKVGKRPTAGAGAGADAVDQDCIFGQWGDWMACGPDGTKTRFRNVFQMPSGSGKPCPPAVETLPCNDTPEQQLTGHSRRRQMLTTYECPAGYDGCSVPKNWYYYHLFVPSCNLHDICYSCDRHKGWEFASKSYCDKDVFYNKMFETCKSYWPSTLSGAFNRIWCTVVASGYYTAVVIAGQSGYTSENHNTGRLDDGCHWKPWDPEVNNVNKIGFHPAWAGCPCDGTSCSYGNHTTWA
ncbi:hypothetical protein VaNZ11_007871 [Volvox africanus]|uniref:LysM domain-containing protein n=1 Tax=Volvox africanus TaxID=51714 RepID=A0ABQ5S5E7_9CHLO|nr:hypothetical protein VaNZ11_007871 [Volvox africanus]